MTKNPFLNAIAATAYIALIASFLFYGTKHIGPVESVFIPITMLSLFVLSAAVMAFVFCYQPIQLFLEGQKKEATNLFLKTLGSFAAITIFWLVFLVLYSRK